jgi:protein ImuB
VKHVLCAYLRHWPIDRLCRRRPELRHKPLVLVESTAHRQTIVHVSPPPHAPADVYPGMALTEGRARCAELLDFPITPEADRRGLEALGRRLMRFSPQVCVAPPASIFLDAGGLERLFGGLDGVRDRVEEMLAALSISAGVAIAPTPGAAWALAAFRGIRPLRGGVAQGGRIITRKEQVPAALEKLPAAALRLESQAIELLASLGVQTIGALLALSRGDLAVRFGQGILTRIDQALGAVHEPLQFLVPRTPIEASLEFESAIYSLQTLQIVMQELVRQVVHGLALRGLGAKELRLVFRQPYGPAVEKTISLLRPSRSESALVRLIGCALEQVHSDEDGFVAAALLVPSVVRMGDEQAALIGADEQINAAELDHLVERLRARLDKTPRPGSGQAPRLSSGQVVEWGELLASHLPECAARFGDIPPTPVKTIDRSNRIAIDLLRPLRLLRQPRAIDVIVRPSHSHDGHPVSFTDKKQRGRVHRLDHIRGPERISGQWWNGRWKIRDYFDVLDSLGGRYWIFRVAQSGRWFLHGIFE